MGRRTSESVAIAASAAGESRVKAKRIARETGALLQALVSGDAINKSPSANLELYMYNRVVQSQFSHSAVVNRMESCSSLAAQAIGLKG